MKKKEKVLVAMSGGVDSSVAAALLLDEGYEVTGAFMINYDANQRMNANLQNYEFTDESCWLPDYRDALRVVAKLGISLIKLDFTKEYNDLVLSYMFREYEAGRTPNPDVMCNKFVKFGVWLDKAKELGYEKLATGHYARLGEKETRNSKLETSDNKNSFQFQVSNFSLLQAKDDNKDQTYFLHQLNQEQLSHIMFPIGGYLKSEVRRLATKLGLPTAEKEESMGICFIGEVPMKEFLKDKMGIKNNVGDMVMSGTGEVIGKHDGLSFYTIGQRHFGSYKLQATPQKTGQASSKNTLPLYVIDKNIPDNILVIGYEDDPLLYKKEIIVKDVNWISGQMPDFPLKCKVRLRHRQKMQNAQLKM